MNINECDGLTKQCVRILRFMRDHGSINPMQALNQVGCMRLAARISDLRKAGYQIEDRMITSRNRYGETVHYKEYRLAV